jgi:hypothetical protein
MSQFTKDEIEVAEELLTEILVSALTCKPHLREGFSAIADGIARILSEEAVERSKDYAKFRVSGK